MSDLNSLPYTVWGKIKRAFGAFALSARGTVASRNMDLVGVEIGLDGPSTSVRVVGTAGENVVSVKISWK
jgi:hypothetical protein